MESETSKSKERKRESPSGWHFYSLYMQNPKHWYLKYALGLRPAYTKPALLFGGAFHEGVEAVHKKDSVDAGIGAFKNALKERKNEYEDVEQYETDLQRGPRMLDYWYQKWSKEDKERYENVYIEKEFEFGLGPGKRFKFTVRPDRVVKERRTGFYYVMDTKTTGWSISRTIATADSDDQLTSYIWAMKNAHPDWNIDGGIVDVVYNRNGAANIEADRSVPIYKSDQELKIFELTLVGLIAEVSQKYRDLKKYPWPLLFRRHGFVDSLFGCEYGELCKGEPPKPGVIPPGYVRDEWAEVDYVLQNVPDFNLDAWTLEKELKK